MTAVVPDRDALKAQVCAEVDRLAEVLVDVSRQLHARPELGFQEHFAHQLLADTIAAQGVAVERSAFGVETAFRAAVGSEGRTIGVLCEYDALPEIGHACGHNVIAAAGLGAGLAAASVAEAAGGRVVIYGTPAEEGGGGKIEMARHGAFTELDAAMMVHPADADLTRIDAIAVQQLHVQYHGKAAHAAAAPHEGRNALDAAVLGYQAVAALRQHILPTERLHGVFTRGGDKPNIVPAETAMHWYIRSPTIATLQPLKARVLACLESGAAATGCTMTHDWEPLAYADMRDNAALLAAYSANAATLGRVVEDPDTSGRRVVGSTDMGNVSHLVPAIHPMIQVAPPGVPIHTVDFARYAGGPGGDRAVVDGAKLMAMTVVDAWCDTQVLGDAAAQFAERGVDRSVLDR
jgi:amidohydrolase